MKKKRVFFGSLEEQERERLAQAELKKQTGVDSDSNEDDEEEEDGGEDGIKIKKAKPDADADDTEELKPVEGESAVDRAIRAGNINLDETECIEVSTDAMSEERSAVLMEEFDRKKRLKAISVPTDDSVVKARLRELGHPICLFAERPEQRRDRLRELLSVFEQLIPGFSTQDKEEGEEGDKESGAGITAPSTEVWYHEGPEALRISREWIAGYSLPRARERLRLAKLAADKPDVATEQSVRSHEIHRKSRALINFCSQIGDTRPLTSCRFSPSNKILATTSWSGLVKLWSSPDGELVRVLRGHGERACAVAFHPEATLSQEPAAMNLVSCGSDGAVLLWDLENEEPIGNIEGHDERVADIAFHPSGRFLATACFDKSWRLWDLEQQQEVLHQEGHSKECYSICFQRDGSLLGSGGWDARGLIWDLRTGRCILKLDGHLKKVTAIDFSPNGYQVATGSEDQKCCVWDLRKHGKCIYTIPAHSNIVSRIKFTEGSLITSSYDSTAKIWSAPTWAPLNTLAGHEQKVTCVDMSSDGTYIATTSFDRTFKLWGPEYLV